ncbi:MAG TPA: hypothetical protein DD377_04420 [Firmicutes bacterium]|nr:hypothetical protein [Bacillota bacterium]
MFDIIKAMKGSFMKRQKSYYEIFYNIVTNSPTTRRKIEAQTGYSWGTVSSNVCALIDDGFIEETSPTINGIGRSTYSIIPNKKFVTIGVSINSFNVSCSVSRIDGDELYSFSMPFDAKSQEETIALIVDCFDKGFAFAKDKYSIFSIGLCNRGYIDSKSGILERFLPIKEWKPFPIKSFLEEKYHTFVSCNGDMYCLSVDYCRKYRNSATNTLLVSVSDGLGFSFPFVNGTLNGLERIDFGHSIAKIGGEECACGKKGCLEAYCSLGGVLKRANLKPTEKKKLFDNEEKYQKYIDEAAKYLGIALINVLTIFRANNVVLTGEIANIKSFPQKLKQAYLKYKGTLEPDITISVTSNISTALGVAFKAAEERILNEEK